MTDKLPAEARILLLSLRIDNLWAGAGDYTEGERAWAIAEAEDAMTTAINELRRTLARESGQHVYH